MNCIFESLYFEIAEGIEAGNVSMLQLSLRTSVVCYKRNLRKFEFKYQKCGACLAAWAHTFAKYVGTTSKFWAPQKRHKETSILRAHKYWGATLQNVPMLLFTGCSK